MATKPELHARIEHDLTLQPPKGEDVINRMEAIRAASKNLAHLMIDVCPNSPDLDRALTNLVDANRCAIAALALHQDDLPSVPSEARQTMDVLMGNSQDQEQPDRAESDR